MAWVHYNCYFLVVLTFSYLKRFIPFGQIMISHLISAGLEEFYADKSKCQEQFDVYKECKKKEVSWVLLIPFVLLSMCFALKVIIHCNKLPLNNPLPSPPKPPHPPTMRKRKKRWREKLDWNFLIKKKLDWNFAFQCIIGLIWHIRYIISVISCYFVNIRQSN